jgi:CDP-diacylglycerol---glycerol-3-phosphate 3-phosphatidyltransferase
MPQHESRYRLKDLLLPPAWLSWSRVPLAFCFARFVNNNPTGALIVLAAAGLSDILDGWVARRYGLVTATGAALDPITDKVFVLGVVVSLVASGYLGWSAIVLLSTREIGELPLVVWLALSPRAREVRAGQAAANVPGKLATALQFATVAWALFRKPGLELWLGVTAVAGAVAALNYWRRALRSKHAGTPDPRA